MTSWDPSRAVALLSLLVALAAGTVAADPKTPAKQANTKKAPAKSPSESKSPSDSRKDPPPAPPPRKAGPEDDKARGLLEKLGDPATRKASADALQKIAPLAVDAIGEWIVRPHANDADARRKVLAAIKATVPDKTGRFNTPWSAEKGKKTDDETDWLAQLAPVETGDKAPVGTGEVIADVIALQALAATNDVHAAQLIFNAGFHAEALIYRDEVGRLLRRMEPASIPALTRESQIGATDDRRRYARYQIERLDREDPLKALDATNGDEALQLAVLAVFKETKHREAVRAVWSLVDNPAPKVRAMARDAWSAYVTGPPPPPAPRVHLKLPGGKYTKYPKPKYMTYRELADNELRKSANDLFKEDYPLADPQLDDNAPTVKSVEIDVLAMTDRIFKFLDERRTKTDAELWVATKKKAKSGDLVGAVGALDRMIAENADRPQRVEMAQVYAAYAKQLEKSEKWSEASVAFSKAHGLDPKGAAANDLLAGHHYTLGRSLNAQGKNGEPDIRRAIQLRPDYAPPKAAEKDTREANERPVWMLYAAAGAAGLAMLLFAAAMMRRRARA